MFRHSRLSRRGVTVFELAASLSLVAVLVGGVVMLVRPGLEADKADAAMRDAIEIREAVLEWKDQEATQGCPTISQLMHDKKLDDSARTDDPWGGRFRIECTSDDISVSSAGRDGQLGTDDDIRVPHSRS
jgi:hypothetical protein